MNGAGDAVVLMATSEHPGTHDHAVDLVAMTHEPGGSWDTPVHVPSGDHFDTAQATIDSSGGVFADWSRVDGRAFYSARPAGGPFAAAVELPVNNGKLVSDAAGDQLLVWGDAAGPAFASFRPAGGTFGAPINLAPGQGADPSQVAMNARGDAVVLLDMRAGGGDVGTGEEAVYRPAGGSFGAPQTLDTKPAEAANIGGDALAISANGTAVALWRVLNSDGVPTLFAASKAPGGSFGPRETLQPHDPVTASDLQSVALAIGPQGDAVASWWAVDFQQSGTDLFALRAAYEPAGGTFGSATQLTPEGEGMQQQAFAVDSSGTAIGLWQRSPTLRGNWETEAALRPAHGAFGAPITLASHQDGADQNAPPQVTINSHGEAFLVWNSGDGLNETVQATERSPGGVFAPSQTIGPSFAQNVLSVDDAGDALLVTLYWVAGYDAGHVLLRSVTFPPSTFAGEPTAFSASASDVWGAQVTWEFGDKATGTGSPVSHAYAKAGTYTVTVIAETGPADQVSQTGTIRVRNAIWKLRVSPRTLRLSHRCSHGHCGAKVSYRLALGGKVKLWVERRTHRRRTKKGFVRLRGTLTRRGKRGRNAFRFDDRLRGRRLGPGRYVLFAQAPTGQVVSTPFRITR
jgi:PKD domain